MANKDVQVSFSQDLGLFEATMIGIGAMIGAGIFVLTGIAAGVAGPASILAFALNGVVTLLTALSYAELASAYPESGGGYSYIRKAFPGPVGFASGWMLWFCYIIACSLYALGFGSYFWEFVSAYFPSLSAFTFELLGENSSFLLITALISALFILINMRGTALTGSVENILTLAKIAILGVFVVFGLAVIFGNPSQATSSFTPFFPKGLGGVFLAMGLTFIAFEGYDLIATVAEEIKEPQKNIPRAIGISLAVTVAIYLLIIFVSLGAIQPEEGTSWEFLGKYQETAIVRAAEDFMPFFGVALIIFGGLLSTLSALNATILASSRVAFSMGRDKMLPPSLSTIHPTRRTPHIAVAVTGVVLIIIALLFPIHVVGSAASLMFLLTFALVNLAVLALRRKFPEVKGGFRIPFYPVTPILAIILNVLLAIYQYEFDPRSWYIAIGWVLIGLFIYFMHFEKQAESEMPQVLTVHQPSPDLEYPYRILLPVAHPEHVIPLVDLAVPIAKEKEGEIVVLSVVDVPQNLPIHEGMRFLESKSPILRTAVQRGKEHGVPIRSTMRVAHRIYDGILQAADAEEVSLILMGWKGFTTTRDRIFGEVTDKVVHLAPCDLISVKLADSGGVKKILIPTAGGPHASLAAEFVALYQDRFQAEITVCYVIPENASQRDREAAMDWIEKTIKGSPLAAVAAKKVITADRIATGLIKTASDYDLIALGASKEGIFSSVLFGEIPEKVARYSRSSVMIVKRYEGIVKSLVKKVLG
jgi:amino acid transporter/nucleotide-binding universal stress UspA family protein